jgi:hypothetical protein
MRFRREDIVYFQLKVYKSIHSNGSEFLWNTCRDNLKRRWKESERVERVNYIQKYNLQERKSEGGWFDIDDVDDPLKCFECTYLPCQSALGCVFLLFAVCFLTLFSLSFINDMSSIWWDDDELKCPTQDECLMWLIRWLVLSMIRCGAIQCTTAQTKGLVVSLILDSSENEWCSTYRTIFSCFLLIHPAHTRTYFPYLISLHEFSICSFHISFIVLSSLSLYFLCLSPILCYIIQTEFHHAHTSQSGLLVKWRVWTKHVQSLSFKFYMRNSIHEY